MSTETVVVGGKKATLGHPYILPIFKSLKDGLRNAGHDLPAPPHIIHSNCYLSQFMKHGYFTT